MKVTFNDLSLSLKWIIVFAAIWGFYATIMFIYGFMQGVAGA